MLWPSVETMAQGVQEVQGVQEFKGRFVNQEIKIDLVLDLTGENIDVPGLEGLEKCYGYFQGNINGTWMILKVKKVEGNKAVVRVACDRGNDAEDVEITLNETGLSVQQEDNCIKTIKDNKYVKLPKEVTFIKKG